MCIVNLGKWPDNRAGVRPRKPDLSFFHLLSPPSLFSSRKDNPEIKLACLKEDILSPVYLTSLSIFMFTSIVKGKVGQI